MVYLRFLNTVDSLNREMAYIGVDLKAVRLLEVIAIAHAEGAPLKVTDAISLSAIASPTTIHRKLSHLLAVGLMKQIFKGKDRRNKYLVPTARAAQYFDQLGQATVQALQHDAPVTPPDAVEFCPACGPL